MSNELPKLIWSEDKKAQINSIEELNDWINKFIEEANSTGNSFAIELAVDSSSALFITIGQPESHLEFFSETGRPIVVACIGPWDSDDLIKFDGMGEPCEMEKRYCVPVEDALTALRTYFLTGQRPNNIKWGSGGDPLPDGL
jgi:hypothetical protein